MFGGGSRVVKSVPITAAGSFDYIDARWARASLLGSGLMAASQDRKHLLIVVGPCEVQHYAFVNLGPSYGGWSLMKLRLLRAAHHIFGIHVSGSHCFTYCREGGVGLVSGFAVTEPAHHDDDDEEELPSSDEDVIGAAGTLDSRGAHPNGVAAVVQMPMTQHSSAAFDATIDGENPVGLLVRSTAHGSEVVLLHVGNVKLGAGSMKFTKRCLDLDVGGVADATAVGLTGVAAGVGQGIVVGGGAATLIRVTYVSFNQSNSLETAVLRRILVGPAATAPRGLTLLQGSAGNVAAPVWVWAHLLGDGAASSDMTDASGSTDLNLISPSDLLAGRLHVGPHGDSSTLSSENKETLPRAFAVLAPQTLSGRAMLAITAVSAEGAHDTTMDVQGTAFAIRGEDCPVIGGGSGGCLFASAPTLCSLVRVRVSTDGGIACEQVEVDGNGNGSNEAVLGLCDMGEDLVLVLRGTAQRQFAMRGKERLGSPSTTSDNGGEDGATTVPQYEGYVCNLQLNPPPVYAVAAVHAARINKESIPLPSPPTTGASTQRPTAVDADEGCGGVRVGDDRLLDRIDGLLRNHFKAFSIETAKRFEAVESRLDAVERRILSIAGSK